MKLKTISFTSFNLCNLNEPGLSIYTDKDGWSQDEVKKKVAWTAEMLTEAQADVFGFQELWHNATLDRAFIEAGLSNDYIQLVPDNHTGKSITCAAAVRKGLIQGAAEWITDFPPAFHLQSKGSDKQTAAMFVDIKKFSRPVLHFKIKPRSDQDAIHVYVCHFKSKGPTDVYNDG